MLFCIQDGLEMLSGLAVAQLHAIAACTPLQSIDGRRFHAATCVQDGFGMLSEMSLAGVVPTVDTFNTLMDACILRHDYHAVLRLFRHMVQSGTVCQQSLPACCLRQTIRAA